jgi:hypothetical protein
VITVSLLIEREGQIMRMERVTAAVAVVLFGFSLSGCNKVTGGGTLEGFSGRATVAFNADGCGDVAKGEFEFVDHNAVVKMHGDVVAATQCVLPGQCAPCEALRSSINPSETPGTADYQIIATYRSTNPSFPGNGDVLACVSDNGEGSNAIVADVAYIQVQSGPFAGYTNYGMIQGNIQQHKCPKGSTF